MSDVVPAITHFFSVSVDSVDLGHWTKMSGIGMSIATTDRPESAMTFFQHHLPGALQYTQITLERPVGEESGAVMAWINAYHLLPVPTAGQIICLDQTGTPVMMWEMIGVTPVSWKGPSFDASAGPNVAMESLTLAHMGFL
jgi:phage tail-like protein